MFSSSLRIFLFILITFSSSGQSPLRNGKDYAVFFYMTDFKKGWKPLSRTRDETAELRSELENNFGFACYSVANPTKQEIIDTLKLWQTRLRPEDQILFFFSSHGYYDKAGNHGYLIPSDGIYPDLNFESWLRYDDLKTYLRTAVCKSDHVLVMLDACYSGSFAIKYEMREMRGPDEPIFTEDIPCEEKIRTALKNPSRLFFASGNRLEETPAISLFAGSFLNLLRSNKNLLRISDIQSSFLNIESPRPVGGHFSDEHKGGDFVLIKKNACTGLSDTTQLDPDEKMWRNTKRQNTMAVYQLYKKIFPEGRYIQEADQAINRFIEDLFWQDILKEDTPEAYQRYLEEYPKGRYKEQALKGKEEQWNPKKQMMLIEGDEFKMGWYDGPDCEKPVHPVYVKDFYLSKFEVTIADFERFVRETNYTTEAEKNGGIPHWNGTNWETKKGVNWRYTAEYKLYSLSESNHPVLFVSWNDAKYYCLWLSYKTGQNYRLPTEAEWEYAAGNGRRHTPFSWGERFPIHKHGGNIADLTAKDALDWDDNLFESYQDGFVHTAPVGSYEANDFGIFDMTGNVWEWCADRYDEKYYEKSPKYNPEGPEIGPSYTRRGGSWTCNLRYKVYTREGLYPGFCSFDTGFRIAKDGPFAEARIQLRTDTLPTIELVQTALKDFYFSEDTARTAQEAEKILIHLGIHSGTIRKVQSADHYRVWGKFPTGLEMQIWTSTYEQGCYGIRFQRADMKDYIGGPNGNKTYFPFCKP